MVRDNIFMLMEQNIMETGKMINRKAMVKKSGLMERDMKDNIFKEKNKEKEGFSGLTDQDMKDNSKITTCKKYLI